MSRLIKVISDGSIVEFDRGGFDDWCVYLKKLNQNRFAPLDKHYFADLKQLGSIHTTTKIYNDFVKIYDLTTTSIDPAVTDMIYRISQNYGNDALLVETWFTVIYAGMIAEENKVNMILKKRIKRLGVYQVLIEGFAPSEAANFSKGKKWRELDSIMKVKGF
jgi:uncharacterized protein DUF7004